MAIKSDRWIREMSEKHGMIEPYAENQVRLDENGEKLISTAFQAMVMTCVARVNLKFSPMFILQLSILRILMTKALSILNRMSASFLRTHLHLHVQ